MTQPDYADQDGDWPAAATVATDAIGRLRAFLTPPIITWPGELADMFADVSALLAAYDALEARLDKAMELTGIQADQLLRERDRAEKAEAERDALANKNAELEGAQIINRNAIATWKARAALLDEAQRDIEQLRAKHYAAENELRVAVERLYAAPLSSDYGVDRDDSPAFWATYDDWLAKRRLVPETADTERTGVSVKVTDRLGNVTYEYHTPEPKDS